MAGSTGLKGRSAGWWICSVPRGLSSSSWGQMLLVSVWLWAAQWVTALFFFSLWMWVTAHLLSEGDGGSGTHSGITPVELWHLALLLPLHLVQILPNLTKNLMDFLRWGPGTPPVDSVSWAREGSDFQLNRWSNRPQESCAVTFQSSPMMSNSGINFLLDEQEWPLSAGQAFSHSQAGGEWGSSCRHQALSKSSCRDVDTDLYDEEEVEEFMTVGL